jgi:dTDP-4-amino-4,6-dideoxygalactose transaminase
VRKDYLVFGSPCIGDEERKAVDDVLRSCWLGTGPQVARFEREFRTWRDGWGHPVALNSCTAALHLSLLAAGIGPGDEVITTPLTFCATVNAIIHCGATPVLADVDPETMCIDPTAVEAVITPRTKAVLPVHFAGRPCDMDRLVGICERHRLVLIEDCAHAIETRWRGRPAGTFGQFGCFSFYVTKNVVTGEGGMVLCANEASAARVKMLGLHGMSRDAWKRFSDDGYKHYHVVESGFKYNMMDVQAAIGLVQLTRVQQMWQRRQEIWAYYQQQFEQLPAQRPGPCAAHELHGLHLYTLLIDEARCKTSRDRFLSAMHARNLGCGVHYLSIPEHPVYQQRFGWRPEAWPHAMRIGRQTVSLPLSAKLTADDLADVTWNVQDIILRGSS